MFGRKTKAQLEETIKELTAERAAAARMIINLERRLKMLVVESNFWKDQTVDYGNQIEFWQRKNRELLEQMIRESTDFDLRAYAESIKQAILDARPEPSTIAAIIATADKDVQGAFSLPPREPRGKVTQVDDGPWGELVQTTTGVRLVRAG